MPAKDPTTHPNLWQQHVGQDSPSPTSSKKTFLEEEPDVDAPKQTRLSTNSSSKIQSAQMSDIYAALHAIRSEAIDSLLTKMRRDDEQRATAAAEGGGSSTLRGYGHASAVSPNSLSVWDVHGDVGQHDLNKVPDWNLPLTNKEADQHLTNVEVILRGLNEVKDGARKYGISFITASPFPRWILGALYEMRLTVAFYDAQGEGMLSFLQRHTLSLAKVAVKELEEMKGQVEKGSELGVDAWGTIDGRGVTARPAQDAGVFQEKTPPHDPAKSAATVEDKHSRAKVKLEDETLAKKGIDGSLKGEGKMTNVADPMQDVAGSQRKSNNDQKGAEPKTLFIGEVNGGIYHFVDTAGEVSCTCRRREPQDPVDIPQYKLTQLMNTLLSHEHAEVRLIGGRMFSNGITAPVDRDGNYIQDWV